MSKFTSSICTKLNQRCRNPYDENDAFSIKYNFTDTNQNLTALKKCHIIQNFNESSKCNEWVFDKTYYQSSLTEDVKKEYIVRP